MKRLLLSLLGLCIISLTVSAERGRYTLSLDGQGWSLWKDKEAVWANDRLYLPHEAVNLAELPINPPTGGWEKLHNNPEALPVSVPGTVEEYLTTSDNPRPEHSTGVSWWYRTINIPADLKGRQVLLSFESVRMRAEVYLDGKLVAYDLIGETPFQADITEAVKPGTEHMLAVRVTNPGGNFHWQDFDPMKWGEYTIPPSRGFSGIIGRVKLECVDPVYVADLYIQNRPEITTVNAVITLNNETSKKTDRNIEVVVKEKGGSSKAVFTKVLKNIVIAPGIHEITVPIEVADAKLWNLDTQNLYTCHVSVKKGRRKLDDTQKNFGFRWFCAEGIGKDAVLRLNGERVMMRSAISWGYFPATGLIATEEMAEKQVMTAKELGMNTLNFHRSIGSPVVLEKADELGLLYYEEPGSFHSAADDPFIRTWVNEKLQRMVYRDRSHPSLVIYNLINEFGGVHSRNKVLVAKRMNDMRKAHAIDPSRIMTFTSGWAHDKNAEEDSKAHMMPFDTTLYMKGWFDNHRAGGPATYLEEYYKGPDKNYMYTDDREEIYFRGEEGAISTPPRIQFIADEIERTGKTGWDGLFWMKQYKAFKEFFEDNDLAPYFGTLDNLTRKMGNVQLEHQGRRIQSMRMQNIGDGYMVNGWEAMPYDNHSGIVDIYRNPKGDIEKYAHYLQPLFIAVTLRNQVVKLPAKVVSDFYIVNEENLNGDFVLEIALQTPEGNEICRQEKNVKVSGGDVFGELLWEAVEMPLGKTAGTYRVTASLKDKGGKTYAEGFDEVVAVDWSADDLSGNGAYYGEDNDKFASFYKETTGRILPAFNPEMGRLDWLVVNRSSLDEPALIPASAFKGKDGKSTLKAEWYRDQDFYASAGTNTAENIDYTFVGGAQPDELVSANQPFSVAWEGELLPPESGLYLIGIETDNGVRVHVEGEQLIDVYHNDKPFKQERPVIMEAGKPVRIRVIYRQSKADGKIQLKWSRPSATTISPYLLLDRVKNEGTNLVLLGLSETWMKAVADYAGLEYDGYYAVGQNWVGGIHFVKEHPLFDGLPVNDSMSWPYQAVVRNGDQRFGFRIKGEDMAAGSYRSTPFELGTNVGVIPCGKGKIIFSTLDIADNLSNPEGPAEVARKLICNYIKYHKADNINK